MGWNSRRNRPTEPRGVFTGSDMETAIGTLDKTCYNEISMFVPQRFHREAVLPWLFSEDTLAKLRAVKGMVNTDANKVYPIDDGVCDIVMEYKTYKNDNASVPAIEPCMLQISSWAEPLLTTIASMQAIHEKYGRVKHLLRWFNMNATEGAVRNYWPAAMSLCPNSSVAQMTVAPVRYNTPAGIGEMLPLIRETAGTVAAMQLVPADVPDRPYNNMRLILNERPHVWEGIKVALDKQIVNL